MAFVCSYTAAKNKIKRDYTGGTCVIPNTWCRGGSAITTRNSEGYFKIFILIVFELLTFHHALIFQILRFTLISQHMKVLLNMGQDPMACIEKWVKGVNNLILRHY